jgi:hypothetical protein
VAVEVYSVGLPWEWYFVLFRLAERGGKVLAPNFCFFA